MSFAVKPPFEVYPDVDGQPLDDGFVYIGEPGLNPEVAPVNVYWDVGLTIPAAQPIRTINGFLSRSGSPGTVHTSGSDYSITVRNKNGSLVHSKLNVSDEAVYQNIQGLSELQAISGQSAGDLAYLAYRGSPSDGADGYFRWDAANLSTQVAADEVSASQGDGGVYVAPASDLTGASGAWARIEASDMVDPRWYGSKGDGATNDTVALTKADARAALIGSRVFLPAGTHKANLTLSNHVGLTGFGRGSVLSPWDDTQPVLTIEPSVSSNHFTLEKFRIVGTDDAAKVNQHGIYSSPVGAAVTHAYFSIRDVRIEDVGGYGIRFESSSLTGPLTQLFKLESIQVRDSHKSCFSFTSYTLDYRLENCNGQMINTDTAGTYPVLDIDGNGDAQAGVSIVSSWFNHKSSSASDAGIGVYVNDATSVSLTDVSVEEASPFIRVDGGSTQHVSMDNIRCNTTENQTNMVELGFARYVNIKNSRFLSTATATSGIKQTSATMANLRMLHIDELTEISGATTSVDVRNNTTISGGVISYLRKTMTVDTEAAAASDDLDFIYQTDGAASAEGIMPDSIVTISPASGARTVVVKHGTGNILLNGAVDASLDDINDVIHLKYNKPLGLWVEQGRSFI